MATGYSPAVASSSKNEGRLSRYAERGCKPRKRAPSAVHRAKILPVGEVPPVTEGLPEGPDSY